LGKRKKNEEKNGGLGNVPHGTENIRRRTGMEESGKEISMREYPLSRGKTIGRRQWLTVFTCVC
jgi:hypothetical protein